MVRYVTKLRLNDKSLIAIGTEYNHSGMRYSRAISDAFFAIEPFDVKDATSFFVTAETDSNGLLHCFTSP